MSDWSWPQGIVAALLGLHAFAGIIFNGEKRAPVNSALFICEAGMWALLLGWGGFWK